MTDLETTSPILLLKSFREELATLNRTVKHAMGLASDPELVAELPYRQHLRRSPSTLGIRCDSFAWDAWDRSIRGENDLHQFYAMAERIGSQLPGLEETDAANLLPGTIWEMVGSGSDLFLPDYWLYVVHHLGWTGQLPYECREEWSRGTSFCDEQFAVVSRLPVNIVQASIDALTVLIDASSPSWRDRSEDRRDVSAQGISSETRWIDQPKGLAGSRAICKRPLRKRAERAANIEALTKELKQHLRSARDHAQATFDYGRDPELLPRPSQKDLAERVGITDSAASRCFNDSTATELRMLWQMADDLESVMKYLRA